MSTILPTAHLYGIDTANLPVDEIAAALRRAVLALEAARREGDPAALAAALVRVAQLRFRMGQYPKARALANEALRHAASDAPSRCDAFQVLANCAAESRSLGEAEACYRYAAELAREIGYHWGRCAAVHGMGAGIYVPRGQFELALAAGEEARSIASRHGQPAWSVGPLIAIAMVCQLMGQHARARGALQELELVAAANSVAQGYHLCTSANLYLDEGDLEAARPLLDQARSIAEASGEPYLNVSARLGMSRYFRLTGDGPTALTWADDALSFAGHVGYPHEQGKALIERGRAAWLCGDEAGTEADLRAATDILADLGAGFDLARARFLLAAFLYRQSHERAADAWAVAARAIVLGGYAFLLEQERELAFPLLAAYQTSSNPVVARVCAALLERLAHVPPPPLRIWTLGRWEVWQGRRSIDKRALRQRRAGELLALLLLSPGRRRPYEAVAEALFPNREPSAALDLFHHATSALRHVLEPDLPDRFPSRYLTVEEGQVTLWLPPGSSLDTELFEGHCQRGEWSEALTLYGGELLPDYPYADWALAPRERLALLHQHALLAHAETCLASAQYSQALVACRRLLAIEPWHEQAVLLGMRACIALNDLAGARRLYLKLEKTLLEDLDTAPQAELQALYRSLTPRSPKKPK